VHRWCWRLLVFARPVWFRGAAHADLCDLRFQPSQGRLASFGLSRGRRAGRHAGGRVSRSVRHSRFGVWCGPFVGSSVSSPTVVVKGGGVHLPTVWDGLSGVALMVCRGLSRQDRPLSWKAWEFERPAAGIVGALVPDYRAANPGGPAGQGAGDDVAALSSALERGRVGLVASITTSGTSARSRCSRRARTSHLWLIPTP
jgi:hypothetical protein